MERVDDYQMDVPLTGETPPAAPDAPADEQTPEAAVAPVVADDAASAPAEPPTLPAVEPDPAQKRRDAAFAAQRRDNAALKARLEALEVQLATRKAATETPAQVSATGPVPEDFQNHNDYVRAVAEWAVASGHQRQTAQADAQAVQAAWVQQETAARAAHNDYDESIEAADTVYAPLVLHAIQTSEQGAELAYYLANHDQEAARISALAPAAGVRALGRLEAQLLTPPTPTPTPAPQVAALPRPLTPVGGAGTAGSTVAPDQLPYDDYVAWYKKTYGHR